MCEKTGLVLEGGGVRGIYTAGILDVFMEHGIRFDGVIGVSAGAIHGCSFLSNQKGRSLRYYKKYCADHRFMSMRSWLMTGEGEMLKNTSAVAESHSISIAGEEIKENKINVNADETIAMLIAEVAAQRRLTEKVLEHNTELIAIIANKRQ